MQRIFEHYSISEGNSKLNLEIGSKFKVQGSRFKVQGLRFKVQGSRFRVQGVRLRFPFLASMLNWFAFLYRLRIANVRKM